MDKMPPSAAPAFLRDGLDDATLLGLHRGMLRIRRFEEAIRKLLDPVKKIRTPCHLSIGQEATAVGVCHALRRDDYLFGNHRSHGHYLAKGGDLAAAMAEIFCKQTGCSRGRGGSMHLFSAEHGILGTSSIVAGSVPLAVGAGLAISIRGGDRISVVFHGDGVPEEGAWNESANFAAVNQLPVLFVCEHNFYCTHLPIEARRKSDNIPELAAAHGLRTLQADGNNVLEVYHKARWAAASIRAGEGPMLIQCRTYRWTGHVGPKDDLHVGLRSPEEVEAWRRRCPIGTFEAYLVEAGVSDEAGLAAVRREVADEVDRAVRWAEASPSPDPGELDRHVYKASAVRRFPPAPSPRPAPQRMLSYAAAINEAQRQALESDEDTFVIGQGVDNPWCVGTTTRGLLATFGPGRIRDVPICENATTGAAVGAAMAGMRPIVFHPRMDFMYLCMDQVFNHCAYWHYMFAGQLNVPLVIRGIINPGGEQGAQHSQSPYSMYAHVPGLKIVMPSNPYDAKGLLLAAVEDENPVLYLDDRRLYGLEGDVPEQPYTVPIGKARVVRGGSDVTLVAISSLVPHAVEAAAALARQGIGVEIVDPRSIRPLDVEAIVESVSKTGRLVVADPAWPTCGVASEIAARVSHRRFGKLLAPVGTVTLPDVPVPASSSLEAAFYPGKQQIIEAVLACCDAEQGTGQRRRAG